VLRYEELKQRYALALPQKAVDIEAAWTAFCADPADAAGLGRLHQAVHRLSGSAPAYGFEDVGAAAQSVDAVFSEWMAAAEFARPAPQQLAQSLSVGICELLSELRRAHRS
jgi:HPt (histidine-containing phosphotransfer) domain-containing protein